MIRILGTIFAGLLGLAFGSFLNVCVSRWPMGESVVTPGSHCRHCEHTLSWWENVPLLSWMLLRGRCRGCGARIALRYPLVELAVGALWATIAWQALRWCDSVDCLIGPGYTTANITFFLLLEAGRLVLCWLLVALAVLDAENLWLPDFLTLPGAALGIFMRLLSFGLSALWATPGQQIVRGGQRVEVRRYLEISAVKWLLGIVAAAALILLIRWIYWLLRRQEGIGLGDVKLMVLLAVWLGPYDTTFAFFVGVVLGALVALVLLAFPNTRRDSEMWAVSKLPLGTFLCVGGIVSSLWGNAIIAAYLRWSGLS
jgi:leader peptidase (prepilin peptidase)/N-methyltransferase